ncbi:MAG: hypothetical protein M0Z79_08200 [Nitrospiraceae bacterium]|nr:hypothetical protein [Nitrospiraceae bacterium]
MPYKKRLHAFAPLLLLSCFLIPVSGFAQQQESANCLACHSSMKGRIKTTGGAVIELQVNAERFAGSVHAALACTDCHMKYADNPHTSPSGAVPQPVLAIASKISAKHPVDPVAAAACAKCHPDIYAKVLDSVHGRNITDRRQTDGALCIDCHGSAHYIVPVKNPQAKMSRKHQVETCGACHGDKKIIEKYKLEENVMDSFQESFHGRKLHLGHTRAPVCASCHGAHDIKTKNDPTSPVFGNNRLQTCGKCHKGANEKFIPAITHKRPGPIPHYTEKGLMLLVIGVFAFIISHVLLEAFSDIRDAIFKKGREE